MKIVYWCLAIVGLYFIYQYTVGNVFREYERCYEKAVLEIEQSQVLSSKSSQCVTEKLVYDEMVQCFQNLQKNNKLAGILYDAAPIQKNVELEFEAHNELCPAYQLQEPKMSIYLNTGSNL